MSAVYGDLPADYCGDQAEISIIPVPYDATSTWQKGADRGPAGIIAASAQLELYDIETDSEVYLRGIRTLPPVDPGDTPEEMVRRVKRTVSDELAGGRLPVVLGGEHSVTIGAFTACADRYPGMSVLQLDAHADLRDSYEGSRLNHACVMARVAERCQAVQVGIRSMDASERLRLNPERLFLAATAVRGEAWMDEAVALLGEPVYITIDLDVFDPAFVPSTGTPEPGGLDWYTVTRFLRRVCEARRVIGFDVVELCPGDNPASDFLAAKLVYKILSYTNQRRAEP